MCLCIEFVCVCAALLIASPLFHSSAKTPSSVPIYWCYCGGAWCNSGRHPRRNGGHHTNPFSFFFSLAVVLSFLFIGCIMKPEARYHRSSSFFWGGNIFIRFFLAKLSFSSRMGHRNAYRQSPPNLNKVETQCTRGESRIYRGYWKDSTTRATSYIRLPSSPGFPHIRIIGI